MQVKSVDLRDVDFDNDVCVVVDVCVTNGVDVIIVSTTACRGALHTLCAKATEPGQELECLQQNYQVRSSCLVMLDLFIREKRVIAK